MTGLRLFNPAPISRTLFAISCTTLLAFANTVLGQPAEAEGSSLGITVSNSTSPDNLIDPNKGLLALAAIFTTLSVVGGLCVRVCTKEVEDKNGVRAPLLSKFV